MIDEPCDYCGNEPDECVCYLAQDFPMDLIPELDTDMLDWEYYEENENEIDGEETPGETSIDGYGV